MIKSIEIESVSLFIINISINFDLDTVGSLLKSHSGI